MADFAVYRGFCPESILLAIEGSQKGMPMENET